MWPGVTFCRHATILPSARPPGKEIELVVAVSLVIAPGTTLCPAQPVVGAALAALIPNAHIVPAAAAAMASLVIGRLIIGVNLTISLLGGFLRVWRSTARLRTLG